MKHVSPLLLLAAAALALAGCSVQAAPDNKTAPPVSAAASTSPTPSTPQATAAQAQALIAAKGYLASDLGFSQASLLAQLTSSYGNGFVAADAQWAIDDLAPDWNAEAVKAAKGYLASGMGFSRSQLIDQLTSASGNQFTTAQATYAADQVGLH